MDARRLPEVVKYQEKLLDPDMAELAACEAAHLFTSVGRRLPFIRGVKRRKDIVRIIGNPIHEQRQHFSIWNADSTFWPMSVVAAAEALSRFIDVDIMDIEEINLIRTGACTFLPMHQDLYNMRRGLLTLRGSKHVQFGRVDKETLFIDQGDSYAMEFTDDPSTSLHHSVVHGTQLGLTMYINA